MVEELTIGNFDEIGAMDRRNDRLVAATNTGRLGVWEIHGETMSLFSEEQRPPELGAANLTVNDLAISPRSSGEVALATADAILIYDIGKLAVQYALEGFSGDVATRVDWGGPNGNLIAAGWFGSIGQMWNTLSREELLQVGGSPGTSVATSAVTFSPDGRTVAYGSTNGQVTLWDTNSSEFIQSLEQHTGQVRSLEYSADGSELVSGSTDTNAIIWEVETGNPIYILEGHASFVTHSAWSPAGNLIATGDAQGVVILWDTQTGEAVIQLRTNTSAEPINGLAWSEDGYSLITASARRISMWRIDLTVEVDESEEPPAEDVTVTPTEEGP
ncbi:MAG: WD40 repeat domain-containing protein [Chloroflexi bacterium]|nr:WD40 repeat domain-containing protein [Chloroflexota bacterium]